MDTSSVLTICICTSMVFQTLLLGSFALVLYLVMSARHTELVHDLATFMHDTFANYVGGVTDVLTSATKPDENLE